MIVSWDWLRQYVPLDMSVAEFEERLMMAGLNHESTTESGGDLAIDLEVTSNRPDCLGHIGVAREASVLWQAPLKLPAANPKSGKAKVAELAQVHVECPELCPRYTARVIRGARIGPSPEWMVKRLATLGIAAIHNVVDVTNYVLMECGQPLHAFDLSRLRGRQIVVRRPRAGERLVAIDHRTYELSIDMCIIADGELPVGLGGIMGGVETEVTPQTTDLLLEAAEFDPACIRNTARRLNLHSDSSYRFERGLDPEGVDWASRRACELILELAGGELAEGVLDVGRQPQKREPVRLRLDQIERLLGIKIEAATVRRILTALGAKEQSADSQQVTVIPPSWRRDVTREVDLIEEVGRIHGYDKIPEDVSVPMAASARTHEDRVLERVRFVMTAAGFDEAMTTSIVDETCSEAFSPWTNASPLVCQTPLLRGADRLRRSLAPSLLVARRSNEAIGNTVIELFEIARVYLPREKELPTEDLMLAATSGGDFLSLKGVLEALVLELNPDLELDVADTRQDLFESGRGVELRLNGERFGYLGEVCSEARKRFGLRSSTTVAEIRLAPLIKVARAAPQYLKLPTQPAVDRDVNLVVDEAVRWANVAQVVRKAGGALLEELSYKDTYRHAEQLGAGKKSLLFSLRFRDPEATLTNQQVDELRDRIVAACAQAFQAKLRV